MAHTTDNGIQKTTRSIDPRPVTIRKHVFFCCNNDAYSNIWSRNLHSGPDKLYVAGRGSLHGSGCGLVTTQIQPVASSRLARRTFARHDPASPAKRFLPQRACCNKICCPRPRTPKLVICARGIGSACGGLDCNMCAPGARQMFAVSVGGWKAGGRD